MKLVGDDPQFQALRARNEARLAALKKANRLTEERNVQPIASGSSADSYALAFAQQQFNPSNYDAQLTAIRNGYPDGTLNGWGQSTIDRFLGLG